MSIFPEVYKKAISIINSPIDMLCEDGSMSVVPTNKAKEAVGVMQEEVARLEQQLAKANERVKELESEKEGFKLRISKQKEIIARYAKEAIETAKAQEKFAIEQKIEAFNEWLYEVKYMEGVSARDLVDSAVEFSEQLRKEQEHG